MMVDHPTDQEQTDIIERSAQANAALMRGDIKRYRDLITLTDDFTLMSPFGGTPTYATESTVASVNECKFGCGLRWPLVSSPVG